MPLVRLPSRRAAGRAAGTCLAACLLVLNAVIGLGAEPRLLADEAGTVRGVAIDPSGDRVPRARVVLATAIAVVSATEANAAGEFHFGNVAAGTYELRVSSAGLAADPQSVIVVPGHEIQVTVALKLSAVTETVVVSAAQVELPLSRVATSTAVVSRDDMDARQVETVADALRSVPGLSVARSGGRGSVTSVFTRGGDSDFTLVLVDGVKVNAFGGGFDFSTLAAADVERVEVVRGPETALFGSDAIAGVVQVITRQGGAPRAEAAVEGGSLGTLRLSAGTWGSANGWSWGLSAGRVASDGFTGTAPATGERVSNDDLLQKEGGINGGWRAASGTDLRLTARLTSHERGYPGPFGSNPVGAYPGIDRLSRGINDSRQAGVRIQQPLGGFDARARLTANASYLELENEFESAYGLSASATRRIEGRLAMTYDLSPAAALSAGGNWQGERATSTFISGDGEEMLPIRRQGLAGFAELRLQPHSLVSLTAGLRAERVQRDSLETSSDPFNPRPAFEKASDVAVNPRVSAAFSLPSTAGGPLSWTRLRLSAGTGMRSPDALEIAYTDNPNLRPERSRSIEAGIDQAWLGDRLVVGATAFFNRYDDLIVAVGPVLQDASRFRTDNISNARARGLESSFAVRTGWGLHARLSHTLLATAILTADKLGVAPPPFQAGDPLLRRPRHQGALDLVFTRGPLALFGRMGARTRVLDVEPSWGSYGGLFFSPGYSVVDAGATWRLGTRVSLLARVGNIANRRYEETFGYPALGRTSTIGVRLASGR